MVRQKSPYSEENTFAFFFVADAGKELYACVGNVDASVTKYPAMPAECTGTTLKATDTYVAETSTKAKHSQSATFILLSASDATLTPN